MMICDSSGRTGIRWMGPLGNLTHTECPHCGGRNCQRPDVVPCETCEGEGLIDQQGTECPECCGSGRI